VFVLNTWSMNRIVVSVKMATAGLLTSLVQLCYSCPNMNLVHSTFSTQRSVHTTQASLSMPSPRQIQMSGFSQSALTEELVWASTLKATGGVMTPSSSCVAAGGHGELHMLSVTSPAVCRRVPAVAASRDRTRGGGPVMAYCGARHT
jgi:hypothetical protein